MSTIFTILILGAIAAFLLYHGRTKLAWIVPLAGVFLTWGVAGSFGSTVFQVCLLVAAVVGSILAVPALRRTLVTRGVMKAMASFLPRMSETERVALEAGTVWWDGDLFSGEPDWEKLLAYPAASLSPREETFINGPLNDLCAMVDERETERTGDLPKEAWEFIKQHKLFGMIIPESYGGLEFSAQANAAVVAKLASRSSALAVTVMVPNSLGPAELLLHYGTEEQKNYYLPRLACGDEIPCFALTEPNAGSDAGGMTSSGVVCRGTWKGEEIVGMRLTWDKRYITLSPIATLLGLAFKLSDPDGLLGGAKDYGITCALIPVSTPGVETGRRHDPLGVPFMNGPTTGKDVFVPLDYIIGGPSRAGQGWMMLMYCLSAGRGISLPSLAAGASQLATRVAGAHATVREQFNLNIGRFEGIEEVLARMGGLTYAVDSVRRVTASSIDNGEKPAVLSAVAKAYCTESMRHVVNDGMDVLGGSGISLGPQNVLGAVYRQLPIGITVEGANILTRTMIIFGQGALRCHPFAQHEVRAVGAKDLVAFDKAFFGHIGFVFQNMVRSKMLAFTDGALAGSPVTGPSAPYFKKLTRMSATFAVAADLAMGTLGGELKRREKLTGRLADVLAWMYMASATLKRFHDEGSQARDVPAMMWACEHSLYECQEALRGVIDNLPNRPAAWLLRVLAFPLGARYRPPSDELGALVAAGLMEGGEAREAHCYAIYVPSEPAPGLGVIEDAYRKVLAARDVQTAVKKAIKSRKLAFLPVSTLLTRAEAAGVITAEQRAVGEAAEAARAKAVAVDSFPAIGEESPVLGSLERDIETATPGS